MIVIGKGYPENKTILLNKLLDNIDMHANMTFFSAIVHGDVD